MTTLQASTATISRLRSIRDRLQVASVHSSTGDQSVHNEFTTDSDALDAAIFELTLPHIDRLKATAPVVMEEIVRLNAVLEELRPTLHALQDKVVAFGYKARNYDERSILAARDVSSATSAAISEVTWDRYVVAGTIADFANTLSNVEGLFARARSLRVVHG